MKNKVNISELTKQLVSGVERDIERMKMPDCVLTGVQDEIVNIIGMETKKGKKLIVNIQCANKEGKTALGAIVLRNVLWPYDKLFFDYPCFREWPFTEDKYNENGKMIEVGKMIKRFRIVGTAENTGDTGKIWDEIKCWWPEGRYTKQKGGKHFDRWVETDTGWFGDVLTFEQEAKEFEGPLISITWVDEPAKGPLMGAITARHSKGGLILFTQTPINASPMLDVLDDLKDRDANVISYYSDIYDNSVTTGKLNHLGTKRGLMTDEEIADYISGIPPDERDARVYGKHTGKSGKVFPYYDDCENVRNYELDSDECKKWNCYCIMDPHQKYYPFLAWAAVTPPDIEGKSDYIFYNEWPTQKTLSAYYDEARETVECKLTPKDISEIIKILDGTEYNLHIKGRIIDPMFERNTRSSWNKYRDGIILEYQRYGICWNMPRPVLVMAQKNRINDLLRYDTMQPISRLNRPHLYIMPHCRNLRRALMRHYWEPGKDAESNQYRCPIECLKMFFAFISSRHYEPNMPEKIRVTQKLNIRSEFIGNLRDIEL